MISYILCFVVVVTIYFRVLDIRWSHLLEKQGLASWSTVYPLQPPIHFLRIKFPLVQIFRPGQDRRDRRFIMGPIQTENLWPLPSCPFSVIPFSFLIPPVSFLSFSFPDPTLFFCFLTSHFYTLYLFIELLFRSFRSLIMRFIWVAAALAAGCIGAPLHSEIGARTTMNPVCEFLILYKNMFW